MKLTSVCMWFFKHQSNKEIFLIDAWLPEKNKPSDFYSYSLQSPSLLQFLEILSPGVTGQVIVFVNDIWPGFSVSLCLSHSLFLKLEKANYDPCQFIEIQNVLEFPELFHFPLSGAFL